MKERVKRSWSIKIAKDSEGFRHTASRSYGEVNGHMNRIYGHSISLELLAQF